VILAIPYIHSPLLVYGDGMRQIELSFSHALLPPRSDILSVPCIFHDAGIAIAIRYVDVTVRRECNVCGPVEGIFRFAFGVLSPEYHSYPTLRIELHHHMALIIRCPQVSFRIELKAMRAHEYPITPRTNQVPCRIEFHDRVRSTM
jgi:hypothetical protein